MKWGDPQPAVDEVGPGWTMVVVGGLGGSPGNNKAASSSEKCDRIYYYSPVHKYKFRSRNEALRFQEELDQTAAPSARVAESAAWKAINNNFERPAVWPSISAIGGRAMKSGDGVNDTALKSSGTSAEGSALSRRSGRTPVPYKRHEMPSGTKHLDKNSAVAVAAFAATVTSIADRVEKEETSKSSGSIVEPAANNSGSENDGGESFIRKLHRIIKDPNLNKGSVSFTPKGLAIQIHYAESFKHNVLDAHFGGMKYNAFIRNLIQHGFTPVTGSASCSWYHIKFIRDQSHMLDHLVKQTNKAEDVAAEALLASPSKFRFGIDAIEAGGSAAQNGRELTSAANAGSKVSYDPYDLTASVWFPRKLYDIVCKKKFHDALCWTPDGRSFQRVDETKLRCVLQKCMGGMKSEDLTLALTRWGFTKSVTNQSIWTNPLFRRNSKSSYITYFALFNISFSPQIRI